jgi:hypothetical protein
MRRERRALREHFGLAGSFGRLVVLLDLLVGVRHV